LEFRGTQIQDLGSCIRAEFLSLKGDGAF